MGDLEGRLLSYVEVRKVGLAYGGLPSPEHLDRERERERESVCMCGHMYVRVCVLERKL